MNFLQDLLKSQMQTFFKNFEKIEMVFTNGMLKFDFLTIREDIINDLGKLENFDLKVESGNLTDVKLTLPMNYKSNSFKIDIGEVNLYLTYKIFDEDFIVDEAIRLVSSTVEAIVTVIY